MKTTSLLLLTLLFASLGIDSARSATVAITPNTFNAVVGSPVQVDLTISDVNNGTLSALGAFDLDIVFDPKLLRFNAAEFGEGLDVSRLGSMQSVKTPQDGRINLFEVSLDSTTDLTTHQPSAFNLATLSFNAIAIGNSVIDINILSLADAKGESLTAGVVSGNIVISSVPEPSIYAFMLAGLGLLGFICHHRKVSGTLIRNTCDTYCQTRNDLTVKKCFSGRVVHKIQISKIPFGRHYKVGCSEGLRASNNCLEL